MKIEFYCRYKFSGAAIVFQTVRAPSTPAQCPPPLSEGADHGDGGGGNHQHQLGVHRASQKVDLP